MTVQCLPTYLSPLRSLICTGNFAKIEVRVEYPEEEEACSSLEYAFLDLVRACLELAGHKHPPSSRLERWKEAESALSWLMDRGWEIYSGSVAGTLVVLLIRSSSTVIEVDLEWP